VDSAYEVDKTALRIRRSVAAKAEDSVHGRTPDGYRREYGIDDKGKRILVGQFPDPAEAKVINGIFDGIQQGKSLRSMATELNASGVPTVTGTDSTPQRLPDIALAPVYAGKRQHVQGAKTRPRPVPGRRPCLLRHLAGDRHRGAVQSVPNRPVPTTDSSPDITSIVTDRLWGSIPITTCADVLPVLSSELEPVG
jgi:hypothetical protein